MAFTLEGASRQPVKEQVTTRHGKKVVETYVSTNILSQGGLVQYCDRCRDEVEFTRFYLSGKLKYVKCTQCQKVYYI